MPGSKQRSKQEEAAIYCIMVTFSVNENEEAARYLLDELSSSLPAELVIAGKEPSPQLQAAIAGKKQVRLISDPDQNTMLDLIPSGPGSWSFPPFSQQVSN